MTLLSPAPRLFATSLALRITAATLAASLSVTLAACAEFSQDTTSSNAEENENARRAGQRIAEEHEVLSLSQVSQRFFEKAETVVISAMDLESQEAAAKKAVELGAPILVKKLSPKKQAGKKQAAEAARPSKIEEDIRAELERLSAKKVEAFGDIGEGWLEGYDVEKTSAEEADTEQPDQEAQPDNPTDQQNPQNRKQPAKKVASLMKEVAGLEVEQKIANPVFVTKEAGIEAAANARAAGAEVLVLPHADPRATKESSELVRNEPTIAIGEAFGSKEYFRGAAELAGRGELPGGGELVFPGRRMIALYGHPSGPALGVMGAGSPEEALAHSKRLVDEYQEFSEEPVIPAFEIITTIASSEPGPHHHYTNYTDAEDLLPYVDAITDAGGYAILDLQPGRASFLDQAKVYEDLLKRPNVGLALDPEWHFEGDEKPLDRVGSVEAHQVNEVTEWLAELVQENNLPQKALVLHQFQLQMLRDREQIRTDHPELAMVLHADGHGTPEQKFDTWNALRQEGLDPRFFMAWKNFYKEDQPTFSPQQTFEDVSPKPWLVSYQ